MNQPFYSETSSISIFAAKNLPFMSLCRRRAVEMWKMDAKAKQQYVSA